MTLCYLGLGSNLKSPQRQLRQAVNRLRQLPSSALIRVSCLYFSRPLGPHVQPDYCNLVVSLHTSLSPNHLLAHCQRIEKSQGRVRKKHWGARTLDIDVLLYGKLQLSQPHLTIPHPHLFSRDFVLLPLLEITPHTTHVPPTSFFSGVDECIINQGLLKKHLAACQRHVFEIHTF